MPRAIAFFGPSTTFGHRGRDGGKGGYVELVKHSLMDIAVQDPLQKQYKHADVYNYGRPAELIGHTARNLKHETRRKTSSRDHTIGAVIMAGAFDHVIRKGKRKPGTSKRAFKATLGKFSKIRERNNMFLVFMGLPGVDDSQTQPLEATGETYNDDDRREYEDITRTHAQENGHLFLDFYKALGGEPIKENGANRRKIDPRYVSFDKVHINGEGHKVGHDLLLPALMGFLVVTNSIQEVSTNGNGKVARSAEQSGGVLLRRS